MVSIVIKVHRPRKKVKILALSVFLVMLVVLSRYPMIGYTVGKVWWAYDDSEYINIADNLRNGNGFNLDILEYNQILARTISGETVYRYGLYENAGRPYYFSGPIYPLFLATIFLFSSAQPANWYMVAATANLFVTILVIAAVYFLARRLFSFQTAFLASIAATMLPSLYWYSIRPLPYPLLFLFVVLAFIVASRVRWSKDWFVVGLIAALAHLTHASGILLLFTFIVWLLLRKNFRAILFLIGGYLPLVMPWMIRNQVVLGDFGLGLGIPGKDLLAVFGLSISNGSGPLLAMSPSSNFDLFQALLYIPKQLTELYSMWTIVVMFFVLGIVGFWKYQNRKTLVPQIVFLLLTLLGYVYLAFIENTTSVETKYLMASLLVLLPLSMYGFGVLMNVHFSKLKKRVETAARIIVILVLIAIMATTLLSFNVSLNQNYNLPNAETSEQLQFHEWVRANNFPANSVVLTNAPHVLYLRTGLRSVYLDASDANSSQVYWLIERYNVSFIAVYSYNFLSNAAILQLAKVTNSPNITEIYSSMSIRFYNVSEYHHNVFPPTDFPELYGADVAILFDWVNRDSIYDSSPSQVSAKLFNNPSWENQGRTHKIMLNGLNQYASIPSVDISGNRTIVLVASTNFAKSDNYSGYLFQFFANGNNYMSLLKMDQAKNNDFWWVQQSTSGGLVIATGSMNYSQGEIMTFILTYNDITKDGIMYYNGAEEGRFAAGGSVLGNGTIYLGCSAGPASYWKGWVGGIFASIPRAMEPKEISAFSEKLATLISSSG